MSGQMSGEVGTHEGSHVYIFDSIDNPTRIVLAYNPVMEHVATPGFGKRGNLSFEEAAKNYVKKQTGLGVDELKPLNDEWDNDGKPFLEPNGVLQYVKLRFYLAGSVDPDNIDSCISEYRETESGIIYRPSFEEICSLSSIEGLASETIKDLGKYFNIRID